EFRRVLFRSPGRYPRAGRPCGSAHARGGASGRGRHRSRRQRERGSVTALVILGVIVAILAIYLLAAIKIVREYQRIVLFRLGRCIGTRGPGLAIIVPPFDRATWVDLRELYLEIPKQSAITKDNAPINIDFIIFYKVMDAVTSVLEVQNFAGAALNIAATTLRSVVGDMSLDDVLSKREAMNHELRAKLDETTERWGVKVTNVEVQIGRASCRESAEV